MSAPTRTVPCAARRIAAFTLIELLVVLAIVALLLTLALPRYHSRVDLAREGVLRENLRVARLAIDAFRADVGRCPRSLEELVERRYLHAPPVDPLTGTPASWQLLSDDAAQDAGVCELRSGAPGTARDGTPYAQW